MTTPRTWLDRVRLDTTPLRTSRDFRLLFAAGTVFYLGGMVSYVAVPFQLYQLTHSNLAVGAMGAVELVPLLPPAGLGDLPDRCAALDRPVPATAQPRGAHAPGRVPGRAACGRGAVRARRPGRPAGRPPSLAGIAVVLLAVAGAADMVSALFRQVIWHQTIPDAMRGRLAGIEMLSYSIGPLGGQTRAGLVADLTSVRASIVSGGVLCAVGVAATATFLRSLWSYESATAENP